MDGAGKPLPDAVVSVEFTTFKAITNAQGKYSVGYVPGKVKVLLQKAGYTSATIPLDIAIETTFPAAPVTLHKIPQHTCEVCIGFQGRTLCRSASAGDDMMAIQSARDDACKSLVTDKTAISLCGQTPPARVTCQEH